MPTNSPTRLMIFAAPPSMQLLASVVCLFTWLALCSAKAPGEDWPTYRHDRLRSAVSGEKLALPLERIWEFRSRQSHEAPRPTDDPMRINYPDCVAYSLPMIAAGESVFFTSAADGRVVALDAATGREQWQFVAGGGVNRAPLFSQGKLYFGSDDGLVYCVDAQMGTLVWKFNAAQADRWFISYGKLKSVWPIMTDVMVDDGVAYFAAGVFPHDGTFLYAVNAETGELVWSNGTVSENLWRLALAPGGYLYVTQKDIWVPKDYRGYSLPFYGAPTPFNRADGSFSNAFGTGDDPERPKIAGPFWPLVGAAKDGVRYCGPIAWKVEAEDSKRETLWQHPTPDRWVDGDSHIGVRMKGSPVALRYDPDACTVILAGDTVFHTAFDSDPKKGVGSGVYARKTDNGEVLWSDELPERANQVIAANGRLFVGTRSGTIYSYATAGAKKHGVVQEKNAPEVFPANAEVAVTAEAILEEGGHRDGYALVLDCQEGALAYELANRSNLYVCAVFENAEQMQKARDAYQRAGVHLKRIVTLERASGEALPLPAYFADLVVSEAAALGGKLPASFKSVARHVKPIRGVALIGGKQEEAALQKWTADNADQQWQPAAREGQWVKWTRPILPDAGRWTHMYGDAGRTLCSHDRALKAPLGVVWHGEPFVRWGTKHTPLIVHGILVNPDAHALEGYDQYTGRKLWRTEAGNIGGDPEQLAASDKHVYIRYGKVLVQLDLLTGKEIASFRTQFGEEHGWGWFAVSDDGKTVYGAAAGGIFASEMETGQGNLRWKLGGPDAEEKIGGMTAMSDGRIYVLGGEVTDAQRAAAIAEMRAWFATQPKELLDEFESQVDKRDIRLLTAIDAATGKILYRRGVDTSNCGGAWLRPVGYGAKARQGYDPYIMSDIYAHNDVLVIGSQGKADKGWSMWSTGAYQARAMTARDGKTGDLLWYHFANYRGRPVIVEDSVIAEPWAFDLKTGDKKQRVHAITGQPEDWAFCRADKQCGIFSASSHFLFGRAMGLAYQDLQHDGGLVTFWHSRSSCYIDCSSGGGMMIKPPQSLGCVCLWSMPFTVALGEVTSTPTAREIFAQPGKVLPVKHLRLDFGATGDMRDSQGNLWLRSGAGEGHPLLLGYNMKTEMYEGGGPQQRSAFYTKVDNTDDSFLFASALVGVKSCTFPLTAEGQGNAKYRVRLAFNAPPGDKEGQRVFSVRLAGKEVLKDFDIVREAGGVDRAVWKEFDVDAADQLLLELIANGDKPSRQAMPLVNAVEVLRQ